MSVSSRHNKISRDSGVDDLSDNILVGESDDQSVLGRVVLVLSLSDQLSSSLVISLSLSSSSVLDLESLEVSLVFKDLLEGHLDV